MKKSTRSIHPSEECNGRTPDSEEKCPQSILDSKKNRIYTSIIVLSRCNLN